MNFITTFEILVYFFNLFYAKISDMINEKLI